MIRRALQEWKFCRVRRLDVIRELQRDLTPDVALLLVVRVMGTGRDFEPLQVGARVLVWVRDSRQWWISPRYWRPVDTIRRGGTGG